MLEGKMKAPVEEKDPFGPSQIAAGDKKEAISPKGDGNPLLLVLHGRNEELFQIGLGFLGDKKPRYGGEKNKPPGDEILRVAQPVDRGDGPVGDIAPGGQAEEIFPFFRRVGVDRQGFGDLRGTIAGRIFPFPGKEKKAPGVFHILKVLYKGGVPVV
jgi:hypothetical protein